MAATQVMIVHGLEHLGIKWAWADYILAPFPGVPIFFAISGFLISASYERNPNLRQYAWNRALRIYPALWLCLFISVLLAIFLGDVEFPVKQGVPWLIAQLSFAQFYNPDFLRGFGVGTLNGSLWTISVELQFYLAVPVIYWLIGREKKDIKLFAAMCLLAVWNVIVINMPQMEGIQRGSVYYKLLLISLPTYLYLFMVGILLQRCYRRFEPFFAGRGVIWLGVYLAAYYPLVLGGFAKTGNGLNPVLAVLLAITVVSFAFTKPNFSRRVLFGNDVSYGIYIYHMPVINSVLALSMAGAGTLMMVVVTTYILAVFSWVLVEKKSLRLKRNPLHVPGEGLVENDGMPKSEALR